MSWVGRRGGSTSFMGFPVSYPTSTSKHSDWQRGFEVIDDVGLRRMVAGGLVTSSFGGGNVNDERPELRE